MRVVNKISIKDLTDDELHGLINEAYTEIKSRRLYCGCKAFTPTEGMLICAACKKPYSRPAPQIERTPQAGVDPAGLLPCPKCGSLRIGRRAQYKFDPQKKCLDCGQWAASGEEWNALERNKPENA